MKDKPQVVYSLTKDGRGIVCISEQMSFAITPVLGDTSALVALLNEQQLPAKQCLEEVFLFPPL